jgi:tetratricopeptide (TPR) repeat protein
MSTFAAEPPTSRATARALLFASVAGVLVLAATRQPGRELARSGRADQVVARVPARTDAAVQALEALRRHAERAPADRDRALALVRAYIEASRREGDPRYLGAAEAALAPFTALRDPVAPVRLLRATVLQSRHDFPGALVDLDRALEQAPTDAQTWLTRATVLTVIGRYDEARASCDALTSLGSSTLRAACLAPIQALTGEAEQASAALEMALQQARDPSQRAYLHSLAGEVLYWSGAAEASERHLRAALTLDAGDRYTRALYADLLLDTGRAPEAKQLVRAHRADDALLLREALAELALGHEDAPVIARVSEGFAESRLRGDSVHQREEARLWLARGDAKQALTLSLASWRVQHEAWDARVVLEAAKRSGEASAAQPVLAWLDATQFAAPRLRALAAALRPGHADLAHPNERKTR